MKKRILFFVLALILIMVPVTAFAEENVIITIDSKALPFDLNTGIPFVDANSRTQVPFRITLETFGAKVDWDNNTQTAIASKDGITVKVPIGQNYILKNEEKIAIDTVAILKNEKTYLPIRAVIEALGGTVEYDAAVSTVVITTKPFNSINALTSAIEKSQAWKNYLTSTMVDLDMNVAMQGMKIPVMTSSKTDTTMFIDLLKSKDVTTTDTISFGKTDTIKVESYMEATDKGLISYSNETGKWTKDVVATDQKEISALMSSSGIQQFAQMKDSIVSVNYFGNYTVNEKELQKIQITVDMKKYGDVIKNFLPIPAESEEQTKMILDALSSTNGLVCTIWLDAKTGEFVKCDMDMTAIMKKMFGVLAMVPGISEEEKAQYAAMELNNVKISVTFDSINACKDFEIPEEAKNAQPTPIVAPKQ